MSALWVEFMCGAFRCRLLLETLSDDLGSQSFGFVHRSGLFLQNCDAAFAASRFFGLIAEKLSELSKGRSLELHLVEHVLAGCAVRSRLCESGTRDQCKKKCESDGFHRTPFDRMGTQAGTQA